jgi:hypothetical protein
LLLNPPRFSGQLLIVLSRLPSSCKSLISWRKKGSDGDKNGSALRLKKVKIATIVYANFKEILIKYMSFFNTKFKSFDQS